MVNNSGHPEYPDLNLDDFTFRPRPWNDGGHSTWVLNVLDSHGRITGSYIKDDSNQGVWTLYEAVLGRLHVLASSGEHLSSGILQDWVVRLGLRHQGCLVSAVRGPDNEPKEGPSKRLTRFYRACVLNAHVGDPRKAKTFMLWIDNEEDFWEVAEPYLQSFDHFHNHFVMHFLHAVQICGYKMPGFQGEWWNKFYHRMVKKLHLSPETEEALDLRLNASEKEFGAAQKG